MADSIRIEPILFTSYNVFWGGQLLGKLKKTDNYYWFHPNDDLGYELRISSFQMGQICKALDRLNK